MEIYGRERQQNRCSGQKTERKTNGTKYFEKIEKDLMEIGITDLKKLTKNK